MTGKGDLGLTGGPQTCWLNEFTAKVSYVGVPVFSSCMISVESPSGTLVGPAMAVRIDFNKTFRRIAQLLYWFPKSLTCSKSWKSKLLWRQVGGKLSQAKVSFQIQFFSVTKMAFPSTRRKKESS